MTLSTTPRTTLRKAPQRASYEQAMLEQIIDESLLAHISWRDDGDAFVLPTVTWRVKDAIYIHGANNSRMMKVLASGVQACCCFTLLDGWKLARSAYHHSANYRCAMVFGQFVLVEDDAQKNELLNQLIDQISPQRSQLVRPANARELAATMLLRLTLTEASVKVNSGSVNDDAADMEWPVWAGVVPLRLTAGEPQADAANRSDIGKPLP